MARVSSLLLLILLPCWALADTTKVAGNYIVHNISQSSDGFVHVDFVAVKKTGKYDNLRLVSDHVHMGVKINDQLRIAADVINARQDGVSLVRQVLIFLPSAEGVTPVWMLSRKLRSGELRGAKMLEMHSPNADYRIFEVGCCVSS